MNVLTCIVLVTLFVVHVECVIFSWLWSVNSPYQSSLSNSNSSNVSAPVIKQKYCTRDRHCGTTNYCHRHYGTCHKCKTASAKCRRDHVCCKGFECAFGSCRRKVKRGNYLAKCKKDKHCSKGLCCAKSHGEFVCKPMLMENDICSFLEGGVAYSVNHGCPCGEGLVCKRQKIKSKRKNRKVGKKDKTKRCQKM